MYISRKDSVCLNVYIQVMFHPGPRLKVVLRKEMPDGYQGQRRGSLGIPLNHRWVTRYGPSSSSLVPVDPRFLHGP